MLLKHRALFAFCVVIGYNVEFVLMLKLFENVSRETNCINKNVSNWYFLLMKAK